MEHKTSQYLKYAIGEIILVVIGILIALQINNWNEGNKDIAKSKNHLSEILKDLETDTISFNKGLNGISTDIEAEEWVLNSNEYNVNHIDSLWLCLGGFYYDYAINDRTFQKVQNAGDSKLIGFELVADEINNYYTVIKKRLDDHTTWDKKETTENQEYIRDLEEHIEISNYRMEMIGIEYREKSFTMRQDSLELAKLMIEFANSTRGRNHYKNNYIRHLRLRNQFKEVKQAAIELIDDIKNELKQFD
jgi:hypothetical protein